jgi:hypothetical protein
MKQSSSRRRRQLGAVSLVLTALLLTGAAVSWYARSAIVDGREFSGRAAVALEDSDLRTVVADRLVGALTRDVVPDALAVRPLVVPVLAALADTSQFRRAFAHAVGDRHRALIEGETTFRFEIPVGDGVVYEVLSRRAPRIAERIPPGLRVPVLRLDPHDIELAGARFVVDVSRLRWPLLLAALLTALGAALLAGGARAALLHVGVATAGAGLLVAAGVAGLGEFVVSHAAHAADLSDERERGAVHALWSALFADLQTAGLLAALGGAVVAAVASHGLPYFDPAAGWRSAQRAARSTSVGARLARGAGLIALGALIVLEPALLGRVAVVAAGLLVVLVGIAQLAGGGPPRERAGREPAAEGQLLLVGAVAGAVAATVLVVALVLPGPRAALSERAGAAVGCNGSLELCRRRLGEVAFATTHNSYAAADEPGWLFANQRYGIAKQLRDGIRGFLIDIHYGAPDPGSGRIRTDLEAEGSSRNKVARELSPAALRAADRLVGRAGVGRPEGERRPYLCHTLCELGAEPLDEQLELFSTFLAAYPRDVVVLFIEPYVPVDEVERALEETGLLDQAAELQRDEPLPTLRELVRAKTRLIVLAEEDGGTRPWYLPGFSFAQDTPLGARTGAELRCAPNRGDADSPLFLVNHWIDTFPPSPTRNERIGADYLSERLSRCERSRRLAPNLIAVDFYERTDVVGIAAKLNTQPR